MSKLFAVMPVVRSRCIGATSWCAILMALGAASVGMNWAMNSLLP